MKRTTVQRLELLALMATAASLIAHGGDIPTCVLEDAESITANVTGDCGPPGVITISHAKGECAVRVSGDEVGLPRSGSSNHGFDQGFELQGTTAQGNERLNCSIGLKAAAERDGVYEVGCYTSSSARSQTPRKVCEAELTPVTRTCDLSQCTALTCPAGQVPRSAVGTCCPVCVDPPKPVDPPVVDSPCAKVTCPTACPDGQELVWGDDECCPACTEQSPACFEQREQFAPTRAAELDAARACSVDSDCTFTQLWTRCNPGCPAPIASRAIWATHESLRALAEQACSECLPAQSSCTPAELMPGRPVCVGGECVAVPYL